MTETDLGRKWVEHTNRNCLCTGCGLCQSITSARITVQLNSRGYLRPVAAAPLSAQDVERLATICPGAHIEHVEHDEDADYHTIWGPLVQVRAGHASDPQTRFYGSSGGAISALLIHLLESGKVDHVIHIGVSEDNPLSSSVKVSRSRHDVLAASGSRYAPAAPLIDIDRHLSEPGKFAFVGKPCDVVALRNYARLNPCVDEKVAYMISFMCAGVSSLQGTVALLKHFGLCEADVRSLRYRGRGWPGLTTIETKHGETYELPYAESWGLLSRYLQFRCKICPDGVGELADIACADAWFLQDGQPDFLERAGRSMIISRTGRGERLLQETMEAGRLVAAPFDVRELSFMQPYQATRKMLVSSRFLALWLLGIVPPRCSGFELGKAALQGGVGSNLRSFFGTLMRAIRRTSFETPVPRLLRLLETSSG